MNSTNNLNEFAFDKNLTTIAYDSVIFPSKEESQSPDRISSFFIPSLYTLAVEFLSSTCIP